jgi:hypothetical protein
MNRLALRRAPAPAPASGTLMLLGTACLAAWRRMPRLRDNEGTPRP